MKSILTVLTDPAICAAQVKAAAGIAQAQSAHLHVLAVGSFQIPVSYAELGGSIALAQVATEQALADSAALADTARATLGHEDPSLTWSVEPVVARVGDLGSSIVGAARLADLVVALRPADPGRRDEAEAVLEAVMFEGRVPVLLLPAASPVLEPGRPAVVAWNESNEAAAAIRGALPLLRQAASVSVVLIAPDVHDANLADPGGGLSRMLARQGIHADIAILPRTLPRISDVLLRHAQDREAGLLVMGAYGHSRLREALFGGATRDILTDCPLPVLLAH